MKIAYVTMQFPVPSETFASLDVKTLESFGDTVEVYAMRPRHQLFDKLVAQRGHNPKVIHHLSPLNFLIGLKAMILDPISVLAVVIKIFSYCSISPRHIIKSLLLLPSTFYIVYKIKRDKPDIVHLFWGHYPTLCLIPLQRRFKHLPISIFLGAQDLEENYGLSAYGIRNSSLVFTHAKSNTERLTALGADRSKVQVVYRGTIIPDILPSSRTLKADQGSSNNIHLITAARLIDQKGIDDVLLLAHKLKEKNFHVKVTVAGDGPDKERLVEISNRLGLASDVDFVGHVTQDQLFFYMNNADFFVLLSRYYGERLPNVVKEAMINGLVAITTKTKGIDELIESGVDGWIVDDVNDALEKAVHTINTPNLYKTISANGIEKVTRYFDVKKNMQVYRRGWHYLLTGKQIEQQQLF